MDAEIEARRNALLTELDQMIRSSRRLSVQTHWFALVLMVLALACSAAVGLGGILKLLPSEVLGVLGIMPAIIGVAATRLKLQQRSSWHCRKADAMGALRSRLKFQLPREPTADQIAQIAKERDEDIDKREDEWETLFIFDWSDFSSPSTDRKAKVEAR